MNNWKIARAWEETLCRFPQIELRLVCCPVPENWGWKEVIAPHINLIRHTFFLFWNTVRSWKWMRGYETAPCFPSNTFAVFLSSPTLFSSLTFLVTLFSLLQCFWPEPMSCYLFPRNDLHVSPLFSISLKFKSGKQFFIASQLIFL